MSPMAYSVGDVGDVWACAGKMTESTTGLVQESGRLFPATMAPLPAAMDFRSLRRELSECLVCFGLVCLHYFLPLFSDTWHYNNKSYSHLSNPNPHIENYPPPIRH